MEYREVVAKTVDDAITKACIELGISSDKLDYEVVNEGSNGFLGIGSKSAVIKARIKDKSTQAKKTPEGKAGSDIKKKSETKPTKQPEKKEAVQSESGKTESKPDQASGTTDQKETQERREHRADPKTDEEIAEMKQMATDFLSSIFKIMEMEVQITSEYEAEAGMLSIEFAGSDMGILIGKRGQTLDSLQYLTSLVINKGKSDYVRVKLDTEDYRKRRKDTLENLARNIALKVKRTRKDVDLEPMNPYERRIIHFALQDNKYVSTRSEGEEPYRHVVVFLKK